MSIDRVLALTAEQLQLEIQEIVQNVASESYIHNRFLQLFSLRAINTESIAQAAADQRIFFPAELYTDASARVRDILIAELTATKDHIEADHLQSCLAMIGDETVLGFFHHLEHHPLPWREKLHVNPSKYAEKGGWSFTKEGSRYPLVFDECYSLIDGLPSSKSPIKIGQTLVEACTHCGCSLVDMLQIDGSVDTLHFLGIGGKAHLKVCPNCVSIAEVVFCRYALDGTSTILDFDDAEEQNCISSDDIALMNANSFSLAAAPVNPFFGIANQVHNTIGGRASWVQDWEHYCCPDCGKKMKYFAQVHWGTLLEDMEGTLFFELCSGCQIAAMFHQQT